MPAISVVVPTYNRLSQLKRTLEGLEKQTFPEDDFEVIVVSDGSTDGTNEYLQTLQTPLHLKPVFQANQGAAATRNRGVENAQGDLILFVDDDVYPVPTLMEEHFRVHQAEGGKLVVIGPMLSPQDYKLSPWVQWSQDRLREQYEAMHQGLWQATSRQFYTGNTSLPRQILQEMGGFDANFRRAEDVELAYRLDAVGVRFVYCHSAVVYHYEERSFEGWLSIPYVYGRNDVIFTYRKGNHWLLPKIFQEFYERNLFTRLLVQSALGRPAMKSLVTTTMKTAMMAGDRLKISVLPRVACSSLFNLYHYQGIADELGGARHFWDGVQGKSVPSPYPNGK